MRATSVEKSDYLEDRFYEGLEQVLIIFLRIIWKFYKEILMQKWEDRIFSNWQMGMRAYIRIVMIIVLEK
jgi:hypothetical protein